MDIQLFQTFLTVAKLGNMTQAASRLNFTQPAVTGQIRALEQHFGVLLFERVGKKLFITAAGRELISYAEKLMSAYAEAEQALSLHPSQINLGISAAMINHLMLPFLKKFQQQSPQCSVSLELCANASEVEEGILENRFDLGFIQNENTSPALTGFKLSEEELVWVIHPKLLEEHQHSSRLADYPLLSYRAGGLFYKLYEKTLGQKGVKATIEYSESEAMKNAILQGLGCGAMPLLLVRELLESGTLLEFANVPRSTFSIWTAFHKNKKQSRAVASLLSLLQDGAKTSTS